MSVRPIAVYIRAAKGAGSTHVQHAGERPSIDDIIHHQAPARPTSIIDRQPHKAVPAGCIRHLVIVTQLHCLQVLIPTAIERAAALSSAMEAFRPNRSAEGRDSMLHWTGRAQSPVTAHVLIS